jgi:hypothetical protein
VRQFVTVHVGTLSFVSRVSMIRLIVIWIVSKKFLTWYESIHTMYELIHTMYESVHVWNVSFLLESYHQTLWLSLNRFTVILNRFKHPSGQFESFHTSLDLHQSSYNFLLLDLIFLMSESIQWVSESIQFVILIRKLCLFTLYYINTLPSQLQIIESFASILSRSQKLIVHTLFKIEHFFLKLLCSLSV